MTQQPVEANVVLTADNSQYDSAMQQSAAGTDQFGTSVDSLGAKIDRLTKSAGKKLFGIAAVDLAGITAATVAYGHFEKQMTSLNAQAAILNKNMVDQRQTFAAYSNAVNKLRSDFGVSTSEAAGLVQQITKLNGSTANVDMLAKSFSQLAAVTGEAPTQLASSIMQFQKTMGGAVRDVPQLNNTLASLASSTNTTVSAISDFSQSIAPMGRMIGMTTNEVAGVSTAFIRAGQDGYTAANAFNKMVSDIAYSTQTGSPDLAKYANLIGVTVDQFQQMNKTQAVTRIFDELNRQGPAAITTLNRMGLDGMRTMRAITAMSQQTGGIGAAIAQANNTDPGALARGAEAVHDTLSERLARTRSELAMTGEAFGKNFEPPAKAFLGGIEAATKAIHDLAASPLGKFVALVMTAIAPIAMLAGALLTLSKAALVFSGINMAVRSPLTAGFSAGRAGSMAIGGQAQNIAMNGGAFQKTMMAGGQRVGEYFGPRYDPAGNLITKEEGLVSRAAGMGLRGVGLGAQMLGYQFNAGSIFGQDGGFRGLIPGGKAQFDRTTGRWKPGSPMYDPTARERLVQAPTYEQMGMANRLNIWGEDRKAFYDIHRRGQLLDSDPESIRNPNAARDAYAAFSKFPKELDEATKSVSGFKSGVEGAAKGLGYLAKQYTGSVGGGISTALSGAGKLWSSMGGNPLMAGLIGYGLVSSYMKDDSNKVPENLSGALNPYLQAGGMTGSTPFMGYGSSNRPSPTTVAQASYVTSTDTFLAQSPGRSLSQSAIHGMSPSQALAYLGSSFDPSSANAQTVDSIKLDLVKEFGSTQGQTVLNQLLSGKSGTASSFMDSAFNQPRRSFLKIPGLRSASQGSILKQMDLQQGIMADRVASVYSKYGSQEAFAERSKQDMGFVGSFGRYLNANPDIGSTNPLSYFESHGFNTTTKQEEAFLKEIQKPQSQGGMGLTSFSTIDYLKAKIPLQNAKTDKDRQAVILRQVFEGNQIGISGGGLKVGVSLPKGIFGLGVDEQEQKQLLDYYGLDTSLTGDDAVKAIQNAQKLQYSPQSFTSEPGSLGYRAAHVRGAQTASGKPIVGLSEVQYGLAHEGDVNAQYKAMKAMYDSMVAAGKTAPAIERVLGNLKSVVGTSNSALYEQLSGAQSLNAQQFQATLPTLDMAGRFRANTQMIRAMQNTQPGDENYQANQQKAVELQIQNREDTRQGVLQLLYAQRNYDIQKSRAEQDFGIQRDRMEMQYNLMRSRALEDYNLQRSYMEQDFRLQQSRAEFDFHLQQQRASEDFYRSLRRSRFDFNLQRTRDEADFNHQVVIMADNAAKQITDIYARVQVQQTSSAGFLLFNAQDQLEKMQQQKQDLRKLRGMGVSDKVIQQFGLTDFNNAQQLSRMVSDIASNPRLVQQFNEEVSKRLKAARSLVTDSSSLDWQEFTRQHNLSRRRSMEDFQRSTTRSLSDFFRSTARMEEDFHRSMDRAVDDFERQLKRMAKAFKLLMDRASEDYGIALGQMEDDFAKQMRRAAKDLDLMAKTIDGTLEHLLKKATHDLSGHAKEQVDTIIEELDKGDRKAQRVSLNIMKTIYGAFGLKYTAPSPIDPNPFFGGSHAAGGVLPGFTPGRDVHHFYSPTGGNIALSGGEAIMRPEFARAVGGAKGVEKLNMMAQRGQISTGPVFAAGGIYRPVAGGTYGSVHDQWTGFPAVDFRVGTGTPVHAAASGRVTTSKDLISGGQYYSYGRYIQMDHGAFSTLYAHLSQRIAQLHAMINGGSVIGLSGSTGNSTGPHLHFGSKGLSPLNFTNASTNYGKEGSVIGAFLGRSLGGDPVTLDSILKDSYPDLEDHFTQGDGFRMKPGEISSVINKVATKAWKSMVAQYGQPTSGFIPGAPTNVTGNKKIVKDLSAARGWGDQWDALYQLVMSESGFNNTAQNPHSTAYGMFQFLDSTWGNYDKISKTSDARRQTIAGLDYIKGRYGNPNKAWAYHLANGTYSKGAIFGSGRKSIDVGENGPEMVLPLDDRGANFIQNILERSSVGTESKSTITSHYGQPIAHNLYNNYKIDKSTNFTGPITLQAHDPNDFIAQLKARQRTKALTQPQLAGSN